MALKAKDIAEIIGVSAATISMVVNNKPGVSEERRSEIIRKIKELDCGYMLKDGTMDNGNIGFVVYKRDGNIVDESPFFTYILSAITDSAREGGYRLSFIYINKDMTMHDKRYQVESAKCNGLIIFAVEMLYEDLQVFKESSLPFVILDNSFQENDVDTVAINNVQGTRTAIRYLYEMGHREIGYIKSKAVINSFKERYAAFRSEIKKFGLVFREEAVIEVGYSEREVKRDTIDYLQHHEKLPTAFFAENDLIACNAVLAFKEAGYKVPDDVSIIGFDDRPICTMIEPQLTTIEVPKTFFGSDAVQLLIAKIEKGKNYSTKIEIGTKLVIRDSVKKII